MELSEKCIAPLVLGGIIAAGASLAGNAIGSVSASAAVSVCLAACFYCLRSLIFC